MKTAIRRTTRPPPNRPLPAVRTMAPTQGGFCAPVCSVCERLRLLEKAESAPGKPLSQDDAFITLLNAYRPYGGISRLHRLPVSAHIRSGGGEINVEGLVRAGQLCGFQWHHDLWIPLFQLDLNGHAVAAAPQQVIAELDRGFDGWALANWFVQPNVWLDSHRPIEWLNSHLPDVLEAARADRFVATG